MAGLGLIATGAAFLNFRKAKAEYDALIEQRDGLLAVIDTYNQHRLDPLVDAIDENETQFPRGLQYSTLLRVANLVGKVMYVHTSVVLTNTSDQPIVLNYIAADCHLYDETLKVISISTQKEVAQEVVKLIELKAGEMIEVQLPMGVSGISDMGRLRSDICAAAGKRLITSCPKLNIEGVESADIMIKWSKKESTTDVHTGVVKGKPGVLRYCGEAGLR